ncbi:tetratricopeptide repeat protein [Rubrivirga sp. IMCC43871]|uniref:tetratricopeptide repeat protein n=1 Tax=Rubrivirga sp. IMCC43871 TaxID=3391575 RepID=UPI0039900246
MRLLLLLVLGSLAAPVVAQSGAQAARLEGRFVRALTALAIDDDSTALRLLDEILALAPADAAVLATRAEVALRIGAHADAVHFSRRATDAAPDRADGFVLLAAALDAAGQDGSRDALARARGLSPTDPAVLTAVADWAAASGDAALERDVLRDLVRTGDTVAARLRLSRLAERAGDAADALAHARAAARLAPSEPAVRTRLASLTAPAAAPAAAAPSGLEALVAAARDNPRDLDALVRALDALADARDPRAATLADDALLLYASVPAVLASAAEAYAAAGRRPDAQATARRGLAALDVVGDALDDTAALRARFDALLSP